jgi:plastocyanin
VRRILVALAVAVVAVGACGGGGEKKVSLSGSVNDNGTTTLSGSELQLEHDDNYFKPTFVKAQPAQKVTVKLENEGKAAHTFTIDALGVDQEVQPGAKATVEMTLPRSGVVTFYCRFHRALGMQGAFSFK